MITKKEARKQWIEALRSGKYKQTQGVLHRLSDNSYCCLGVACELFAKELEIPRIVIKNSNGEVLGERIGGSIHHLPTKIMDLLGLYSESGQYNYNLAYENSSLVQLNDAGKTFNEIADALEAGDYWR